jgi:hypothetical protein
MHDAGEEMRKMIGLSRCTTPEERLATAVIFRAVQDCTRGYRVTVPQVGNDGTPCVTKAGTPKTRTHYMCRDDGRIRGKAAHTARIFLSQPSATLTFWCDILQISPKRIIEVYTRTIRQGVL